MAINGVALGMVECERKNETLDVLFRLQLDTICEEHINRLEIEVNRLKKERDQLLSDLLETNNCNLLCPACKHTDNDRDTFPCTNCKEKYDSFEWAGLKENIVNDVNKSKLDLESKI